MIDNTPLIEAIKAARQDPLRKAHGLSVVAANNLMMDAWNYSHKTLKELRQFTGTKALLSVPSFSLRSPSPDSIASFQAHLRTLLCVFDTVILAPSPSGISCHRYFVNELNYGGMSYSNAYVPHSFHNVVFPLLCQYPKLVRTGALTAIPLFGETNSRWSHPDLSIPEFSKPYSHQYSPDINLAEQEDFLNLATERIVAERLGAVHVNAFSFDRPYIGDLRLPAQADVGKAILEVKIPGLQNVGFDNLADIRHDLSKERREFSKYIIDALASDPRNATIVSEKLAVGSEQLNMQYTKCMESTKNLTGQILVKSTVFALSATGTLGSAASTIGFLAGGGVLYDLKKLIVEWRDYRIRSNRDSLFFASELHRRFK